MKNMFVLIIFISSILGAQDRTDVSKWEPFKFLIGKWEGIGTGKFGESKVIREYKYLMGGTYLIGTNRSDYVKQEKNPEGETHDNWDIFSYDKLRAKYILRQFHAEDITNTYTLDTSKVANKIIEFETEYIENFEKGWRAKEVYQIINRNEFIEIFYLASPDEEYTEYVRNIFKRIE